MRYQHEKLKLWFMEGQPLFAAHWQEIARDRDAVRMDPDWHRLLTMEQQGNLMAYTAREGSRLAGYAVFLVYPHLHYRNDQYAYADVVYVSPEFRSPRVSMRLMQTAEASLVAIGVSKVQYHIKCAHNRAGALLERMGYEAAEIVYEKLVKPVRAKAKAVEEEAR